MFSLEFTYEPPRDWNSFFLETNLGTFSQTIEYSKYAIKWIDWKPLFFRMLDSKGDIVLQNLVFEYTPGIAKIPKFGRTLFKKIRKSIRWTYGPISKNEEAISEYFDYFLKNKKNFYGTTNPLILNPFKKNANKWATSIIDLRQSKDIIQNSFDKNNCKKNIKRSIERGVEIFPIDNKNFNEYANLRLEYSNKEQSQRNYEELLDFWNFLKPIGFDGFLAKKDDDVLGGLTFSHFNKYLIEVGVARNNLDYDKKLYSQDLIKWAIIEWGIKNKMNYFDLAGYNPEPSNTKEMGIKKYKEKWGGKRFDYWLVRN